APAASRVTGLSAELDGDASRQAEHCLCHQRIAARATHYYDRTTPCRACVSTIRAARRRTAASTQVPAISATPTHADPAISLRPGSPRRAGHRLAAGLAAPAHH